MGRTAAGGRQGKAPGEGRVARQYIEPVKPWRLDSWIPARCEVCGRWPARAVCTDCLAAFADRPARCGRCAGALTGSPEVAVPGAFCPQYPQCPHCRSTPPAFDACACAVAYAYPWDGLIARFKFEAQPGWAGPLAGLMAAHPRIAALLALQQLLAPLLWLLTLPLWSPLPQKQRLPWRAAWRSSSFSTRSSAWVSSTR